MAKENINSKRRASTTGRSTVQKPQQSTSFYQEPNRPDTIGRDTGAQVVPGVYNSQCPAGPNNDPSWPTLGESLFGPDFRPQASRGWGECRGFDFEGYSPPNGEFGPGVTEIFPTSGMAPGGCIFSYHPDTGFTCCDDAVFDSNSGTPVAGTTCEMLESAAAFISCAGCRCMNDAGAGSPGQCTWDFKEQSTRIPAMWYSADNSCVTGCNPENTMYWDDSCWDVAPTTATYTADIDWQLNPPNNIVQSEELYLQWLDIDLDRTMTWEDFMYYTCTYVDPCNDSLGGSHCHNCGFLDLDYCPTESDCVAIQGCSWEPGLDGNGVCKFGSCSIHQQCWYNYPEKVFEYFGQNEDNTSNFCVNNCEHNAIDCPPDIDNDGIYDCNDDCVGGYDECGICNGDGSSCWDCCEVPNGSGDTCNGACGPCGDSTSCDDGCGPNQGPPTGCPGSESCGGVNWNFGCGPCISLTEEDCCPGEVRDCNNQCGGNGVEDVCGACLPDGQGETDPANCDDDDPPEPTATPTASPTPSPENPYEFCESPDGYGCFNCCDMSESCCNGSEAPNCDCPAGWEGCWYYPTPVNECFNCLPSPQGGCDTAESCGYRTAWCPDDFYSTTEYCTRHSQCDPNQYCDGYSATFSSDGTKGCWGCNYDWPCTMDDACWGSDDGSGIYDQSGPCPDGTGYDWCQCDNRAAGDGRGSSPPPPKPHGLSNGMTNRQQRISNIKNTQR